MSFRCPNCKIEFEKQEEFDSHLKTNEICLHKAVWTTICRQGSDLKMVESVGKEKKDRKDKSGYGKNIL